MSDQAKTGGEGNGAGTSDDHNRVDTTGCGRCGYVHIPVRRYRCQQCGASDLRPGAVELQGVVETFTRPRVTTHEEGGFDWGLAIVRLDAGPLVTARLKINGIPIRIGARVAGVAEKSQEGGRDVERLSFALVRAHEPAIVEVVAASEPRPPRRAAPQLRA